MTKEAWEIFNKKFDDILENMSKDDWNRLKERHDKRIQEIEDSKLENMLLPCPFCGEKPVKKVWNDNENTDYSYIEDLVYGINCETTGCYLENSYKEYGFKTFEDAFRVWNTRHLANKYQ